MMKATNSSPETHGRAAGEHPEDQAGTDHHLEDREQVADGGGGVAGQQLVGAYGEHALVGVGSLTSPAQIQTPPVTRRATRTRATPSRGHSRKPP